MKTQFTRRLALLALTAVLQPLAHAGSLRKLWELDLTREIKGPDAAEGVLAGILAVRFSPDGREIAVAGNPYRLGRPAASRLLVVSTSDPRGATMRLPIQFASDSELFGLGGPPALDWSPEGDLILAGLDFAPLRGGVGCGIPSGFRAGFLDGGRVIAEVLLGVPGGHAQSRLQLLDSQCRSSQVRQPEYRWWELQDVSPERGLVSLTGGNGKRGLQPDPSGVLAVADPVAGKVVRTWPISETGYDSRFADHGHALCVGDNGADAYEDRRVPPRCMDVDTGKLIAEARGIVGGAPFAAAENASRVVASDHSSTFNLRFREYDTGLKRRVVWDFRRNVEVASWKPDMQTYTLLSPKPAKDPFTFAISPDGEYIAEGGNGILRLYKIEP